MIVGPAGGCVLIPARSRADTTICVRILLYMSPDTTMCPHSTICVRIILYMSSSYYICVLILLHMCPHPTTYVFSYCMLIPARSRGHLYCSSITLHTTAYSSSRCSKPPPKKSPKQISKINLNPQKNGFARTRSYSRY